MYRPINKYTENIATADGLTTVWQVKWSLSKVIEHETTIIVTSITGIAMLYIRNLKHFTKQIIILK